MPLDPERARLLAAEKRYIRSQHVYQEGQPTTDGSDTIDEVKEPERQPSSTSRKHSSLQPGVCPGTRPKSRGGGPCSCFSCAIKKIVDSEYFGMSLIVFLFILSVLLAFVFLNRTLTFCRSDVLTDVDTASGRGQPSTGQSLSEGGYDRPVPRPFGFAQEGFGGARFKKSSEELERYSNSLDHGGGGAYPQELVSPYPSAPTAANPALPAYATSKLTEFYKKMKRTEEAVRNVKGASENMRYKVQPNRVKRSLKYLQQAKTDDPSSEFPDLKFNNENNNVSYRSLEKKFGNKNDHKTLYKKEYKTQLKESEKDKKSDLVSIEPKKISSHKNPRHSAFIIKNENILVQFAAKPKESDHNLDQYTKTRHVPTMPSGSHEKQQNHPFYKNSQRLDNILDQFLNIQFFPISPAMRDKYLFLSVVDEPNKYNCKHPKIPSTKLKEQNIKFDSSTKNFFQSSLTDDFKSNVGISSFSKGPINENISNRGKHESINILDKVPNNKNEKKSLDKNMDDMEKELNELIIDAGDNQKKVEISGHDIKDEPFYSVDAIKPQRFTTEPAKIEYLENKYTYDNLHFSNKNRKLMEADNDEYFDTQYKQNDMVNKEVDKTNKKEQKNSSEMETNVLTEDTISNLDENISEDTQGIMDELLILNKLSVMSEPDKVLNSEGKTLRSIQFGKYNKGTSKLVTLNVTRNASEGKIKPCPPNVTLSNNSSSGRNNTLDIKITFDNSDEDSYANKTTTIRIELVTSFPIIETENENLLGVEHFDDAKNRFGKLSQDYSDYGVLEERKNNMLDDKKKVKEEHKKTQRSSDKQLKEVTDISVGTTKEKTFYLKMQPNKKEEKNTGGLFKLFHLHLKENPVSQSSISDNTLAYESLLGHENELFLNARNKREYKTNSAKKTKTKKGSNAYKQLKLAIDERIHENTAENSDIVSQDQPRYAAYIMSGNEPNNKCNFKTRSLLSVKLQNDDVTSSDNRAFIDKNETKLKQNCTPSSNEKEIDTIQPETLSSFIKRESPTHLSNISLEKNAKHNASSCVSNKDAAINDEAFGSVIREKRNKRISRNKRAFNFEGNLDTVSPLMYMKEMDSHMIDYDKYLTTKSVSQSRPRSSESNLPDKSLLKTDSGDKFTFTTPYSQDFSKSWQGSKSAWIQDKWRYMNDALKRPAVTIEKSNEINNRDSPKYSSRNYEFRYDGSVNHEDGGIFSKIIDVFHSPHSESKSAKGSVDSRKSLSALAAQLDATCARAAAEVRMVSRLDERASGSGAPDEQSAELMQHLVRLMGELVDYQVQQKTCHKLPSDLQDFLQWLTDPLASGPPPLERPEAGQAGPKPGQSEDEARRSDIDNEHGDTDAEEGGAESGGELPASEAAGQLRELLADYEELSEEDRSQLPGVKNYLLNQLSYVQQNAQPAVAPLKRMVSSKDLDNGPDRYKRDSLAVQESLKHHSSASCSTKQPVKKRGKNFQGRTRSRRHRRKINKISKYLSSKFGKSTSAAAATVPTPGTTPNKENASNLIENKTEHAAQEIVKAISAAKGKLSKMNSYHSTVTAATKNKEVKKPITKNKTVQSNSRMVKETECDDKETTKIRHVRSQTQHEIDRKKTSQEQSEEGFEVPSILRFRPRLS